jgi:hypothetical protein
VNPPLPVHVGGQGFHHLHEPQAAHHCRTSDPWTAQQCRQLAYVAEYTSDIRHIAGTSNVVVDALSQPPVLLLPSPAAACVKAPSGSQAAARQEGKLNSSSSSAVASVVAHALWEGVTWQPAAAKQSIPVPQWQFTHLHVDLVGLLPTSVEGFKYLFTIIDRSTRWVEAIPVKNIEAVTIADALVAGWVSCFGVPAVITSDRGTQFRSAVWEALCKRLNIQYITTTAFHPCNNGMVERCLRQLKDALRAQSAANDWPDHLP